MLIPAQFSSAKAYTWPSEQTFTGMPGATFTGVPTGTAPTTSTLVINPASATANADLLWAGVGDAAKFQVDEDGDVTAAAIIQGAALYTTNLRLQTGGAYNEIFSTGKSGLRIYGNTVARHQVLMGYGAGGQGTLTANLDQDDVLIKRDVDGASTYDEAGSLLHLWRDITNVGTEAGNFLQCSTDGATPIMSIDKNGFLTIWQDADDFVTLNMAGNVATLKTTRDMKYRADSHLFQTEVGGQGIIDAGVATFGDGGTTNYTEIEGDGAIVFHGEAGLAFGEIYVVNNAVETAIAVATTLVQYTLFGVDGQSNNCTPDHTNDHITIDKAGRYEIILSCTVESAGGGGADTVNLQVQINNGATPLTNLHAHRKLAGGGGDIGSMSISGFADLAATDTVELWVANEDSTDNLILSDVDMTVKQLAGT